MESVESKETLEDYVADACKAVSIYFVHGSEDIDKKNRAIKPFVTHQVFGPSENIFGYKNLIIDLFFLPITMECCLNISYNKMYPQLEEGLKPDNIQELITPWIPSNTFTNKKLFCARMEAQDYSQLFGTILKEFEHPSVKDNSVVSKYIITNCTVEEAGFMEFHERFQSLIVWFIEAASYIDMKDPRWLFFYLYEENEHENGKIARYPVGFCTVYKFFAYPDKTRTRISQFFILPHYQRIGLGTILLQTVYNAINDLSGVCDITVEEPNEKFTKMRDYADTMLLKELPEFSVSKINLGFTKQMAEAANKNFLINKNQAKHIYHILRLYYSTHGEETNMQDFRKDIKEILNTPNSSNLPLV